MSESEDEESDGEMPQPKNTRRHQRPSTSTGKNICGLMKILGLIETVLFLQTYKYAFVYVCLSDECLVDSESSMPQPKKRRLSPSPSTSTGNAMALG